MPDRGLTLPGIHVDEIPRNAPVIAAVATGIAAFVGSTSTGPLDAVTPVASGEEYAAIYGPLAPAGDPMGHAVAAYFGNGGQQARVARVPAAATVADYQAAFERLAHEGSSDILILPGKVLPDDKAVIDAAVAHCERVRNCVLIADPARDRVLATAADVTALQLPASSFAALYYPWVTIPDPFALPSLVPRGARRATTLAMPPSAHAAGIWARTDATRGVWKVPGGIEATLQGIGGLCRAVDDRVQEQLNLLGIDCLRVLTGTGPVVWGARTLAAQTDAEWKYLPVRRCAIMIERSIRNSLGWAVFEANDARLWATLRATIEAFLSGLFRAGAFQGSKASDAFYVRCGLGDTMTRDDIDAGQAIVVIGFAPLKPAEFVILKIRLNTLTP